MRNALLGLALLLAPTTPTLADWASGGGEVMTDTQNPWFLKNTATVDVCLIWDKRYFHPVDQSFDGLKARFDQSIAFWKGELANSKLVKSTLAVGTQDFHVVAMDVVGDGLVPSPRCEAADLKVQFGYLTQEQIDFFNTRMGGVQKYLASTVRTSYDTVNMKGRGFIYLKPDSGPLSATSPGIVPNPWILGQGNLVNYALLHELGHMFGVPHKSLESVMAVDYLERAFNVEQAAHNAEYLPSSGFFSWSRREPIRQGPYLTASRIRWNQLLQTPEGHGWIEVRFVDTDKIEFRTSSDKNMEGADALRGTLTYDPTRVTHMWEEAVRIYLPADQTVIDTTSFPGSGVGFLPWVIGPMVKNEEFGGTYVTADGTKSHKMLITTSPQAMGFAASRFSVEIDGAWYFNIDWPY